MCAVSLACPPAGPCLVFAGGLEIVAQGAALLEDAGAHVPQAAPAHDCQQRLHLLNGNIQPLCVQPNQEGLQGCRAELGIAQVHLPCALPRLHTGMRALQSMQTAAACSLSAYIQPSKTFEASEEPTRAQSKVAQMHLPCCPALPCPVLPCISNGTSADSSEARNHAKRAFRALGLPFSGSLPFHQANTLPEVAEGQG